VLRCVFLVLHHIVFVFRRLSPKLALVPGMRRQDKRLWRMIPFWDSVGVAMINCCKAEDLRIICRPGEVYKYLKDGIQVRHDRELHSKILVGDNAAMLGSFNMTYQSMFDNQDFLTFGDV